ncbi:MAG: DegT/DnrJ/EryC1/StrS family aminotransferase [Candidatus Margulisbacteria bacterium]|jgi:dTDP-4-amino-4,6-dideoxygalactose transaminase|nr:DegT/DnrJ/EryC1/StrS family aminotransferase [Candidatus Margulisiibacteriota bacterium]
MKNIPLVNVKVQFAQIQAEAEKQVLEILRTGAYILGQHNKAFETELAEYVGAQYAIPVKSGTDALLVALRAAGIQPGDEVITTPFTFIATAEAIRYLGATPVFVDIEPDSYCIDVAQIEQKITSKTKAILPVHLFGHAADVGAIDAIAQKHNLLVIGDACQSIGTEYQGRPIGGLCAAECYSFYPTKNLGGCGEGGAVTTNDPEFADRVRILRAHGMRETYKHETIGYNMRLDEIQCAILRLKLPKLRGWTRRRQEIAGIYTAAFQSVPGLQTPAVQAYSNHIYHQYTLLAENRTALQKYLKDSGVGTAVHYPIPLNLQPAFADLQQGPGSFPVAESVAAKIFSIPVYPELTDEDIAYIVEKVKTGAQLS